MATYPATYSVHDIAKLFNLTDSRIRQLAREGIIPHSKDGKYHLINCVKGYVKYLQSHKFKSGCDDSHERALKTRLLEAQVQSAEAEARKEMGQYMRVDEVEEDLSNLLIAFRNRILAVPHRAGEIMGERLSSEDAVVIKDLLCEALTELSAYRPSASAEASA